MGGAFPGSHCSPLRPSPRRVPLLRPRLGAPHLPLSFPIAARYPVLPGAAFSSSPGSPRSLPAPAAHAGAAISHVPLGATNTVPDSLPGAETRGWTGGEALPRSRLGVGAAGAVGVRPRWGPCGQRVNPPCSPNPPGSGPSWPRQHRLGCPRSWHVPSGTTAGLTARPNAVWGSGRWGAPVPLRAGDAGLCGRERRSCDREPGSVCPRFRAGWGGRAREALVSGGQSHLENGVSGQGAGASPSSVLSTEGFRLWPCLPRPDAGWGTGWEHPDREASTAGASALGGSFPRGAELNLPVVGSPPCLATGRFRRPTPIPSAGEGFKLGREEPDEVQPGQGQGPAPGEEQPQAPGQAGAALLGSSSAERDWECWGTTG